MNKVMMSFIAAAILWNSAPIYAKSVNPAVELNTKGYRSYKSKNYAQAVEYFEQALKSDSKYALAHYNLACTLAILRSQGNTCEYEAYKSTILEHLAAAVEQDSSRREKLLRDPDLNPIRDTVGYQKLLDLSPKKPEDFQIILQKVHWYGEGRTIDPQSLEELQFYPGGKVTLRTRSFSETNRGLYFGRWNSISGTYKISGNEIFLYMSRPYLLSTASKPTRTFRIKAELGSQEDIAGVSTLTLSPPDGNGSLRFFDQPSECEAF